MNVISIQLSHVSLGSHQSPNFIFDLNLLLQNTELQHCTAASSAQTAMLGLWLHLVSKWLRMTNVNVHFAFLQEGRIFPSSLSSFQIPNIIFQTSLFKRYHRLTHSHRNILPNFLINPKPHSLSNNYLNFPCENENPDQCRLVWFSARPADWQSWAGWADLSDTGRFTWGKWETWHGRMITPLTSLIIYQGWGFSVII